jgi:hypothetical protein
MPNDHYSGRTAPLTSKRCILYIYSTYIGAEYFKHGIYSSFFFSKCSLFHNSNVFGSCIIHILYTGCAKIKKNNSGAKRLSTPKSARHGSVVITIQFPRYVFLTCGSSQNAHAGTHGGTLARVDVMAQVTEMYTHQKSTDV